MIIAVAIATKAFGHDRGSTASGAMMSDHDMEVMIRHCNATQARFCTTAMGVIFVVTLWLISLFS